MRVLFAIVMFAYAAAMVRYLWKSDRRYREQRAEYEAIARIADLPDDEFVAWCKENGRG